MAHPARSFVAGVLVANSAPHLATAASGRRHLTPLGGRDSGPRVNAVWGLLNLGVGLALLLRRRGAPARWNADLPRFEAGFLVFAVWMALAERIKPVNWMPDEKR
ncbi:hypothetical protein SAMN04489806_0150 [Paramicrobacterium humi]|uniref:Uncharacterized protein n=1 Tax=Paramicrobacterium humi TaxID=640635 RepID=A0A1H4ISJ8_9MICO|nr:hypothetical protein [Microbacterium humi]SEB36258.1 hypothetical protein SAMN04489806_0150 [Microbacterium humi]